MINFDDIRENDINAILLCCILGIIIVGERYFRKSKVDSRIYMFVIFGSCLFTLVCIKIANTGNDISGDLSRMLPNIITGLGFLGTGVIGMQYIARKDDSEPVIHGIVSATLIWLCGTIGIACGLGYSGLATIFTLLFVFFSTFMYLTIEKPKKKEEIKGTD